VVPVATGVVDVLRGTTFCGVVEHLLCSPLFFLLLPTFSLSLFALMHCHCHIICPVPSFSLSHQRLCVSIDHRESVSSTKQKTLSSHTHLLIQTSSPTDVARRAGSAFVFADASCPTKSLTISCNTSTLVVSYVSFFPLCRCCLLLRVERVEAVLPFRPPFLSNLGEEGIIHPPLQL
jgi:hypothetical protein